MTLLFITRKVDRADANAGFLYNWLNKLSLHVEQLIVICQEKGYIDELSSNIKIYSLGKEKKNSKFKQFFLFQYLLFKLVSQVDGIFTHMMPIYAILAGPWAKIFNKKLIHWYTHASVDWRLKLSSFFVSQFATASQESFNLKTSKPINVLGHGIDTRIFNPVALEHPKDSFNILTVGRISPTKDYESMIKAVYDLVEQGGDNIHFTIIGDVGLATQQSYFNSLQTMVDKMKLKNIIKFLGAVPNYEVPNYLKQADLFINLSGTGSLDKAILEAMASKVLVLTSNKSFKNIIPSELFTDQDNPHMLAQKIKALLNLSSAEKDKLKNILYNEIIKHHNLDSLVKKIVNLYK